MIPALNKNKATIKPTNARIVMPNVVSEIPIPSIIVSEPVHLVRVYNGKRGLHIVMLYLVVRQWRILWGFRVYRGKDTLQG